MENIVVYHRTDADGLLAGSLMKYIYREKAKYVGVNYTDDQNYIDLLDTDKQQKFIFVDYSPIDEFLSKVGDYTLVEIYDHHMGRVNHIIDNYENNFFNLVVSTPNNKRESGCAIVYRVFRENFTHLTELQKIVIDTISRYDTWTFKDLNWDEYHFSKESFINFMMAINYGNYDLETFYSMFSKFDDVTEYYLLNKGRIIADVVANKTQKEIYRSYMRWLDEDTAVIIYQGIPNIFTEDYIEHQYGFLSDANIIWMGFNINMSEQRISFEIRSKTTNHKDTHALDFLKINFPDSNGGGHSDACGFSLPLTEGLFTLNSIVSKISSLTI